MEMQRRERCEKRLRRSQEAWTPEEECPMGRNAGEDKAARYQILVVYLPVPYTFGCYRSSPGLVVSWEIKMKRKGDVSDARVTLCREESQWEAGARGDHDHVQPRKPPQVLGGPLV